MKFEKERRAVGTLLLDGEASAFIFKDPYRMSIDVMADGAKRRVAELVPLSESGGLFFDTVDELNAADDIGQPKRRLSPQFML